MGGDAKLIQEFHDWSADALIRNFSNSSPSHRADKITSAAS
jgi:hypothetical protein